MFGDQLSLLERSRESEIVRAALFNRALAGSGTTLGQSALLLFVVWVATGSIKSLGWVKRSLGPSLLIGWIAFIVFVAFGSLQATIGGDRAYLARFFNLESLPLRRHLLDGWLCLAVIVIAIAPSLWQELLLRAYLVSRLEAIGLHTVWLIALPALAAGAMKLSHGVVPALFAAILGACLSGLFLRTRNLPSLIGASAIFNLFLLVSYLREWRAYP